MQPRGAAAPSADTSRLDGHGEVAQALRLGLMLALTVLLPALLFGLGTVGLALREERALQPGFGQRGPGGLLPEGRRGN